MHFHTDYLHFPLFAGCSDRTLTTLHGRLDLPDLPVIMREFAMMPLVSISAAQQAPLPWANWYGTVLHGLPRDLHRLGSGASRLSRFSRPDRSGKTARPGHHDCPPSRNPAADRREGRSRRPRLFFARDCAAFPGPPGRVHRRDRRRREEPVSRQCCGVAVSDRLARTVRAGADRSAGHRHAGGRPPASAPLRQFRKQ